MEDEDRPSREMMRPRRHGSRPEEIRPNRSPRSWDGKTRPRPSHTSRALAIRSGAGRSGTRPRVQTEPTPIARQPGPHRRECGRAGLEPHGFGNCLIKQNERTDAPKNVRRGAGLQKIFRYVKISKVTDYNFFLLFPKPSIRSNCTPSLAGLQAGKRQDGPSNGKFRNYVRLCNPIAPVRHAGRRRATSPGRGENAGNRSRYPLD
jgi:hypothetical protein